MKQIVMMSCLPSLSVFLSTGSGFFGASTECIQEVQLAFYCQRVGYLAGPNGFHSWASLSSLYHQVSSNIKKTHLPLGCTRVSAPKEIRLLASYTAPGYHFAPNTWWFSQCVLKSCMWSDMLWGKLRKCICLRDITAVKAVAEVDHQRQVLFCGQTNIWHEITNVTWKHACIDVYFIYSKIPVWWILSAVWLLLQVCCWHLTVRCWLVT